MLTDREGRTKEIEFEPFPARAEIKISKVIQTTDGHTIRIIQTLNGSTILTGVGQSDQVIDYITLTGIDLDPNNLKGLWDKAVKTAKKAKGILDKILGDDSGKDDKDDKEGCKVCIKTCNDCSINL